MHVNQMSYMHIAFVKCSTQSISRPIASDCGFINLGVLYNRRTTPAVCT
jgi:hypothetical protein